ncbi:SRPBCC family protein [Fumia xinanensis]|uniref:SRPBCC family protein n=1 Tax=Fumia xinanensis TaxID=2763659 RepID=A0A926E5P3_9FIRM|nr:SRPBCC family protein [Fumia xinanensis]MBC8560015.1 SRPBCC family protein [Fumia xinanensis]PWL41951.1 MAG: polyketide cyclase [Clostridiales bacterium]
MAVSNMRVSLQQDIEKIWSVVTDLSNWSWRSDLSKIKVLEPHKKFVEYTKDGFPTTFTITALEPMTRYAFDLENDRIKGHWEGLFTQSEGFVSLDFTETVTPKSVLMRPFMKPYLKKQQSQYFADLQRALKNCSK